MQLSHPGNHDLTGFFLGLDFKRGVFQRQAIQGISHLFLVLFRFGLNRHGDNRFRKLHHLQHDGVLLIAQRVAGRGELHPDDSGNLTGIH